MKIHPQVQWFIYITIVVCLFCSCGNKHKQSKSDSVNEVQATTSILPADKIINSAIKRIRASTICPNWQDLLLDDSKQILNIMDTVAGNFRVTYCIMNNDNTIANSQVCDIEIIFNVQFENKDIVTDVISRNYFTSLFNNDNIDKFSSCDLDINRFGKDFIVLNTSIRIPDSDRCHYYNIHIDKNGISGIVDVTSLYDSSESDIPCHAITETHWEQLTEEKRQAAIARLPNDSDVLKYYNGEFKVSDDDRTFDLLKILSSKTDDKDVASLYVYLFNKIMKVADGALSEVMYEYCPTVFNRNMTYLMELFKDDDNLMESYASCMAESIAFSKYGNKNTDSVCEDLVDILNADIADVYPDKDLRTQFIGYIKRYIKIFKD